MEPTSRRFRRLGILFLLSAPSGAGKTTLCTSLKQTPDLIYSVSCTTRAPRPGEIDGQDYYFLSKAQFTAGIARGEFLEHAEVHGNFYGTRRADVLKPLEEGIDVLIDVDTQGAALIRSQNDPAVQNSLADVFIMPPSLEELRRRLMKRGSETPEQIETRIRNAASEMRFWRDYRYTIISGSMEEDLQKFRAIMRAERYLSKRIILEET